MNSTATTLVKTWKVVSPAAMNEARELLKAGWKKTAVKVDNQKETITVTFSRRVA